MTIQLQSVITCPNCGFAHEETMPTATCQVLYRCTHCGTILRPKTGDCCVYCSYGSVQCASKQAEKLDEAHGT